MAYTLTSAANACGKSKATLLRAIRTGRLSAAREGSDGPWLIEPAELHRVFPSGTGAPVIGMVADASRTPALTDRTGELIAELRETARLRDETIADLRRRLDAAEARLDRLLLTDQRSTGRRWWHKLIPSRE